MQAKVTEWKLDVCITQRRDGANEPLGIIAVQGPRMPAPRSGKYCRRPRAATEGLKCFFAAEVDQYFIASTGYTGEDGYEIMLPAGDRVKPCGTNSTPPALPLAASVRATRCASKPA